MSPRNLSSLGDLKRDPRNPRRHGERNLQQIEQSLKNFGAGRSIVIDEKNQILAGNGLVEAAGNIGLSKLVVVDATGEEIVAVRRRGLTERQKSEYRIADNRSAELAEWDPEVLAALAEEIDLEQFWSAEELEALLAEEPEQSDVDAEPQTDRAAELQEQWKVERGQVWQLGNHRLMCGDCTDKAHVGALLAGCVPFLAVIDPPYGVEYDADWRNHALRADGSTIAGKAIGKVTNDDRADWRATWELFPGDVIYSWHPAGATSLVHAAALQDSGFTIRMQIIWAKNQFPIGRGDYHVKHEPCWYCVREGKPAKFTEDRTQNTLWEIDKPHKSETGHSTQKPVECMARPIRNHGGKDDDVYDPFVGSGTTIIAAEQLNRRAFCMEIEPKYVSVCLQRFQDATQKEPILLK